MPLFGTWDIIGSFSITVTGLRGAFNGDRGWSTFFGVTDANFESVIGQNGGLTHFAIGNAGGTPDSLPGALEWTFTTADNLISLDGNAPISFETLPAGFKVDDGATASCGLILGGSNELSGDITGGSFVANGITFVIPPISDGGSSSPLVTYANDTTMDTILLGGLKITINLLEGTGNPNWNLTLSISSIHIQGGYHIELFQFNMQQPENPVKPGDVIDVTSDKNDPNALDFSGALGVTVDGVAATFTIDGANHLSFVIPAITKGIVVVIVNFLSGPVTLGKLMTILFLNASGIYQLFPGKSNDTIYDADNGGTFDAKIPDPFIKTAFLP